MLYCSKFSGQSGTSSPHIVGKYFWLSSSCHFFIASTIKIFVCRFTRKSVLKTCNQRHFLCQQEVFPDTRLSIEEIRVALVILSRRKVCCVSWLTGCRSPKMIVHVLCIEYGGNWLSSSKCALCTDHLI